MGRKENREDLRELRNAEQAYFTEAGARQHVAREFHKRAEALLTRDRIARCGNVDLFPDHVVTPSGTFRLTPEVTAGVDHAGAISSRVTMTRLVATGIFALALQKKKDDRELFLYIDTPEGQHVEPCPPTQQAEVRRFAALVTTAAREGSRPDPAQREALREEARVLAAEYDEFERGSGSFGAAGERLRVVEQRMLESGTLPSWHDPVKTRARGELAPFRLPVIEDVEAPVPAPDAPPAPAGGASLAAQLETLAALLREGHLTAAEFETAKAKVLGA